VIHSAFMVRKPARVCQERLQASNPRVFVAPGEEVRRQGSAFAPSLNFFSLRKKFRNARARPTLEEMTMLASPSNELHRRDRSHHVLRMANYFYAPGCARGGLEPGFRVLFSVSFLGVSLGNSIRVATCGKEWNQKCS
jgi:hypothetical protein